MECNLCPQITDITIIRREVAPHKTTHMIMIMVDIVQLSMTLSSQSAESESPWWVSLSIRLTKIFSIIPTEARRICYPLPKAQDTRVNQIWKKATNPRKTHLEAGKGEPSCWRGQQKWTCLMRISTKKNHLSSMLQSLSWPGSLVTQSQPLKSLKTTTTLTWKAVTCVWLLKSLETLGQKRGKFSSMTNKGTDSLMRDQVVMILQVISSVRRYLQARICWRIWAISSQHRRL